MPLNDAVNSLEPCLWDVIPDDVKHIIGSLIQSHSVLMALNARPTTAPVPVFPSSVPLYCNVVDDCKTLIDIQRYFVPRNIVHYHGPVSLDLLLLLQKSPTPRFGNLSLELQNVSEASLPQFRAILSRVDVLTLRLCKFNKTSVIGELIDMIDDNCTELDIHNLPCEGSFIDLLCAKISRMHSLRMFHFRLAPFASVLHHRASNSAMTCQRVISRLAATSVSVNSSRTRAGLPWLLIQEHGTKLALGATMSFHCAMSAVRGTPMPTTGVHTATENPKILSLDTYSDLRSIGMQPRDLLFYMPKAAMNAPFTREQALEFFDMLCHELRYSWSSRARVPVDTIARICIALPDQLHRVAKLVVAYGDSRDFAEDMKYLKTLAPDVFSKLFVEINAFVPTYIFSDYENFQDFMEDYSTGTMDAALICLAQETARLRPQACPSASSFADIRKLAMRFIVNGCVTFPKTTPVATVETVQKWYDDFVGLLVNNPDPRFDEYETQSLCDLTMLMVDGGYYELVSYFPMQWVYKETSRNIKRARLVDAIEEERAKRRKVA